MNAQIVLVDTKSVGKAADKKSPPNNGELFYSYLALQVEKTFRLPVGSPDLTLRLFYS